MAKFINFFKKHYEKISFTLAFITIFINLADLYGLNDFEKNHIELIYLDNLILVYFILEYFIRLYRSDNKMNFIRNNKLDLIAILPFNSLLKVFRILKLTKLLKFSKFFKLIKLFSFYSKLNKKIKSFLYTNNLIYTIYTSLILVVFGALGIYYSEKGITVNTFGDALWWSFVTTTTVGYGDVSPTTVFGRVIAVILMITGIGTIGMLTGTFTTFFINTGSNKENNIDKNNILEGLNEIEKDEVLNFIEFLKSKRNK